MDKIIKAIDGEVRRYFEESKDPCHDYSHCLRVYNLGMYLQEREGGDKLVVGASGLLHDLHQALRQRSKRRVSALDSLGEAEEILKRVDFPLSKRENVLHCIEVHDQYGFSKEGSNAETIEAQEVQDADNLDAMGAIGVARTFSYGGLYNVTFWQGSLDETEFFDPLKVSASTIQHFYDKLLRLKENMNTQTAKELAERRHKTMERFVEDFLGEWKLKY